MSQLCCQPEDPSAPVDRPQARRNAHSPVRRKLHGVVAVANATPPSGQRFRHKCPGYGSAAAPPSGQDVQKHPLAECAGLLEGPLLRARSLGARVRPLRARRRHPDVSGAPGRGRALAGIAHAFARLPHHTMDHKFAAGQKPA
eukprot:TRINITY_DN17719_c0_g2_i1.p3 TRINITY_DN17719_c0_g2~~TRINITY_DN17719_c0_g2_i1.p3  ORF type:complete len:143 (+),score=1.70 TRINITY_DN17719_c0_g2_i1:76-504(+)